MEVKRWTIKEISLAGIKEGALSYRSHTRDVHPTKVQGVNMYTYDDVKILQSKPRRVLNAPDLRHVNELRKLLANDGYEVAK